MPQANEFPENWLLAKISDTGLIISGGTPDTSKPEYWQGNILWCTPTDITSLKGSKYINYTSRNISEKGLKNSSANILPIHSLVICTRATIGDCAINEVSLTTNQGFKAIVPNKNWSTEFLYYLVVNLKPKLIQLSSGSTFLELSKKVFENIIIQQPPLNEQIRIAEVLSAVDEKINIVKAHIIEYHKLKEFLSSNLLTRGIGHSNFKSSVIGEIPESWKVKKFEDVTTVITCGVASTPQYVDDCVGVPFLSAQNVRDGKVVLDKYKFISREFHTQLTKNNKPEKGDILYSRVGAKFGEAGIIEHSFEFSIYVSLTLIKVNSENHNYYIKHLLNSSVVKSMANRSVFQGAGVPNLNVKVVRNFLLPFPPIEEQKKIASILNAIDEKIEMLNIKNENLNKLKTGLMQQLLTGKVRVNTYQ
ncbi:restriction endonuclease subunit S [Mucilaginibacter sp. HD30]